MIRAPPRRHLTTSQLGSAEENKINAHRLRPRWSYMASGDKCKKVNLEVQFCRVALSCAYKQCLAVVNARNFCRSEKNILN